MTEVRNPVFLTEDDCYHQLSDDPYETETNWWSFSIPERKSAAGFTPPITPIARP